MRCVLYLLDDGWNPTFTEDKNVLALKKHGDIPLDAEPDWSIEADTWEECMQAYYDYMGWGEYHFLDFGEEE